MDAVETCTTADFLIPANETELPPFELQIEQVLRQKQESGTENLINGAILCGNDQPCFGAEKNLEDDQPEKPHPLRSPVSQRPSFLRAYTISSVPETESTSEKSADNNVKNSCGPVRLKFTISPKGSAWKLEGEEEEVPVHGSTEGTPFVTSGLYFANSVKPIQSPSPHHRKLPSLNLNPQKLPSSKSNDRLSKEGDSVSIGGKSSSGKEDSPSPETSRKHGGSSMQKGIVKLARRLSQKHSKGESRTTVRNQQLRSHSLENLPSPTSSRSSSVERINANKSPKLHRTFSLNQRPSTPRIRENRLSSNARDLRERQKKRKDNSVDALIDAVVYRDENEVRSLLETEEVDVNGVNDEGFAALDFAVMLGFRSTVKLLQAFGAKESPRLHSSFLEKHLKMLLKEADEKVDDLTIVTVNASNTAVSENKENERSLREWESRQRLLNKMMSGLLNTELPGKPGAVSLTVASETSLFVRFIEPSEVGKLVVTKYKIQWSKNDKFTPVECEHVLYDLHSLEYTIDHLRKSVVYYVRVCCGNFKGFGPWLESNPPCATPSSWHEVHDTKPRFKGRLDVIDDLFSRVWQSHEQFSPQHTCSRPRSGTFGSQTDLDKGESPKTSRREAVKKSITKYTNIFFHSAPKFVKNLRRGVYLAALMFTDDGKVLVTLDENLPVIEVDDSYPSSFQQDFCWLMKVACTWKDVKKLKQEVEMNSSSTSALFRCKLLQAADTMQAALDKQQLGQLHYKAVKDRNGSTIIVTVSQVLHTTSFKPRMLSLKWMSSSKLQKKMSIQPGLQSELLYASEMLVLSLQDNIRYFKQSRRKLERGLYIGYLKLRTFVDAIHVVVHEGSPNVLPHFKVRDNPNVSREEWQLLQSFDSPEGRGGCSSKTVREFQEEVAKAAELLMEEVGVSKDAAQLHRIYDREVVELDENVSFLIVFPPPEDVCSAPGQMDSLSHKKAFISLPVQTFEMIHMFTYQRDFICHYSRLSSVLDMDAAIVQQALREAFSSNEMTAAKERQRQLMDFQRELDDTWKGMRWILDALHYARDRQVRGGIPLAGVFRFTNFICKKGCCPDTRDNGKCEELCANYENGVLKVHCAFETGLAPGASVKLHVLPKTTANEVVKMVVREVERIAREKGKEFACISEDKLRDYCLVAIVGSHEKTFKDDYKPLQLQNPWTRGKLYIRLRSEALAASSAAQLSSV